MLTLHIPLAQIEDNPWQTRRSYDDAYITELAADIYRNGLLQLPAGRLIIRNGYYPDGQLLTDEQIAKCQYDTHLLSDGAIRVQTAIGHNRVRAYRLLADPTEALLEQFSINAADLTAQQNRWQTIPMQVAAHSDQAMARMAWSENARRKDLTALEEAQAIQHAIVSFGWTQTQAGREFGLNRATIANKVRLLDLPARLQEKLHSGDLSERQASALLPIYALPEETKIALAKAHPLGDLEQQAEQMPSDTLRVWVDRAISATLRSFSDNAFLPAEQIAEGHPHVRQGRCTNCPLHMRRDGKDVCADPVCFDQKTESWRAHALTAAQRATGLPLLDTNQFALWETEHFGTSETQGATIVTQGCPKERLRLHYHPGSDSGVRVASAPSVRIVCERDKQTCHCLRRLRGQDDKEQAEQAARRQYENEVVKPAVSRLEAALAQTAAPDAWQLALKNITYGLPLDTLTGDWKRLIHAIARKAVLAAAPYNGWEDIPRSAATIREKLGAAGVEVD